jgi:hypothetical protein
MAQRAAEFKLYVAERMSYAGLPASRFGQLAEPLARRIFRNVHMADFWDWRSVLESWSKLDRTMFEEAVHNP